MHATKSIKCEKCSQLFASDSQLKAHIATCGLKFACPTCFKCYKQYESLQTHGRRSGHPIPSLKAEKCAKTKAVGSKPIPIVPKPSKNHIQAALALSELSSFLVCRADIGIQVKK